MVDGQHDFRDGRGGHRFDEARPRANYARLFGLDADHETGNVLNKEQRRSVAVAGLDEISRLFGALGVNDSADPGRFTRRAWDEAAVVGDDADAHAAHARVADDHLFRVIGLEFVEALPIQNAIEHFSRVVRRAVVGWKNVVKIGRGPGRFAGFDDAHARCRLRGQLGNDLADFIDALLVVFRAVMRDARNRVVYPRAAQRLARDLLSSRAFDQIRLPQPHDRVVIENSRRAVLPRKDAALIWQIHARRIDQVNNRRAAPHGNLLSA